MSQSIFTLASKVAFLKIPPSAWDAIFPHGPRASQPLVEFMTAGVVRDIASQVENAAVKTKLMTVGKGLAGFAEKGLVQAWEAGDDICPPWRWPIPPLPWPWGGDVVGPEPDPWQGKIGPVPDPWRLAGTAQVMLADLLLGLASVTAHPGFSAELKSAASILMKEAAPLAAAELDRMPTEPRGSHCCVAAA